MDSAKAGRAAEPLWARETADSRGATLDRSSIVASAIAIADAEGLDSVSIRRVAARLDARPMSLYSHVPSKSDLLDLMFDELAGETLHGDDLPANWRAALTAIARRTRDVGLAHPWSSELRGRRAPLGPNTLRVLDEWMRAVDGLGLAKLQAWSAVTVVNDYVVGYTTRIVAQRQAVPTGSDNGDRWRRSVETYLTEQASSGNYPYVGELLRMGYAAQGDSFEEGLTLVLDALARTHAPGAD